VDLRLKTLKTDKQIEYRNRFVS